MAEWLKKKDFWKDVLFILACVVVLLFLGARYHYVYGESTLRSQEAIEEAGQLPECEEDEFLYPEDYLGPGKNKVQDLKCVHADSIVGEATIVCPDGNVYFRPIQEC